MTELVPTGTEFHPGCILSIQPLTALKYQKSKAQSLSKLKQQCDTNVLLVTSNLLMHLSQWQEYILTKDISSKILKQFLAFYTAESMETSHCVWE